MLDKKKQVTHQNRTKSVIIVIKKLSVQIIHEKRDFFFQNTCIFNNKILIN